MNDNAPFNWKDAGKLEGWRIEKIEGASFAHQIVFDDDAARVMFYLKYVTG